MPITVPELPDMSTYGDPTSVSVDDILPWVIQQHAARKAGLHKDIRFGKNQMYSFATRKDMPAPGGKINLYQTPLHRQRYMHFEGKIPEGSYGYGEVKPLEKGEIIVTGAKPGHITFVTKHREVPERYALIRSKVNPKTWLLSNITPGKFDPKEVGRRLAEMQPAPDSVIPKEANDKSYDCFNAAVSESLANGGTVMMGPPAGKKDTAHFWVDRDGAIVDPTSEQYVSGYPHYAKGKPIDLAANASAVGKKYGKEAAYSSQMAPDKLKVKYPHLYNDPVHRWRADNDVELIHKEPDLPELERIWGNWQEMTPEQQALSDAKSMEMFNVNNADNYANLVKLYAQAKQAEFDQVESEERIKVEKPKVKKPLKGKVLSQDQYQSWVCNPSMMTSP